MWCNLSLRKSIILYISAFVILAILLSAGTATLCNNATKTIESKYPPTGEKYYLTNENGERLGDALYDTIVELEERIEDAKLRKSSIEMETITLDNIYKLMLNFGKLYDIISDEEKKSLITYLIKEIQIYPNGESEQPLKSIEFNFPIYRDGQEVRRLLWEKGNTVETVCLLSNRKPDTTVKLSVDMDDYYRIINGKDAE